MSDAHGRKQQAQRGDHASIPTNRQTNKWTNKNTTAANTFPSDGYNYGDHASIPTNRQTNDKHTTAANTSDGYNYKVK